MTFIQKPRDNGETFYTLSDDAPEGLLEAIREAHQGTMPNDWVWEECKAAFESDEDLTDGDNLHQHADDRVEIYTKALFQWAADMCLTSLYSNAEAEAEEICDQAGSIEDRFKAIQFCAIQSIAHTIAEFKASL